MKNTAIVFEAPMKVSLQQQNIEEAPSIGKLLVKKLYSLISTGTELACLSGSESWFKMPAVSGYCCVSEVAAANSETGYAKGDILFHYGNHSAYQIIDDTDFIVRVNGKIDLPLVPMLRMATIAFTSIRISDIELGDYVAVTGLGLVGNMAAQLAALSGGFVIGIDPSQMRRNKAGECGITRLLDGTDTKSGIEKFTCGKGVHTAIEATGIPEVAYNMLDHISYHGEIILLGTPRGNTQVNLADILRYSHIDGQGSIHFKGAHEWRYPLKEDKFVKHSIERNTLICMKLIEEEKLQVRHLIDDIIKPDQAPDLYLHVNEDRNSHLGIMIDWT